jgi:hypothetical protein
MKKNLWTGILVIVLVLGMAVVGCDNGSTGNDNGNGNENGNSNGNGNGNGSGVSGNPFVGSWTYSNTGSTTTITFYADLTLKWVVSVYGAYVTTSTSSGTYSYNGNTATLKVNGGTSTATLNNSSSFTMGGFTWTR